MDGASDSHESRARIILTNLDRVVIECAIIFNFNGSNNVAEYEVLVASLKIEKDLQVQKLKFFSDSLLITMQVQGEFEAGDLTMAKYL